jgi:hypothetical protein
VVSASLADAWFAHSGEGVVAAAYDVHPYCHEQGEETQVQSPLQRVVRAEMVEGCDLAAVSDHDRGQTSLPRSADV